MFVINHKKIFFVLSSALVVFSVAAILVWGLPFGIDFTGGAVTEVNYTGERPSVEELRPGLETLLVSEYSLRPIGDSGYFLKTRDISEEERMNLVNILSLDGERELTVERFSSVGPTIGKELRNKAYIAILIVVIAIILFIAFAFRKVSYPVSSWKYGVVAIIALLHDIIIPTGLFAVLGRFGLAQVDVLFVMALLAILGFSVNDTIVVFDRIRENLRLNNEIRQREEFSVTVGKSLKQTYIRSLNTSLTTLFVLVTLLIVGGEVIRNFTLTLIVGVIAGTYSSIFLASPLLVLFGTRRG